MRKIAVGIIGCGNISGIYLKNLQTLFGNTYVAAVADLDVERARAAAKEYSIAKACTVEELLADNEIEIVVNLTVPKVHALVSEQILHSGKHVYSEKPLAIDYEAGKRVIALAKQNNLLVGGAPDTFMGSGLQMVRKLLDDNWIGRPLAVTAFMAGMGPESWHPNPAMFYAQGAGPLFDMGPYYITAMVALFGPIKSIMSSATKGYTERIATTEALYGQSIPIETATHVAGNLEFANGVIATLITGFDVWKHNLPCIEIYGTEGGMVVPDPNSFEGDIKISRRWGDWSTIPSIFGYSANSRGLGVADMATQLSVVGEQGTVDNNGYRANGELTLHVLEAMQGMLVSAESGTRYVMETTTQRPAPLATDAKY